MFRPYNEIKDCTFIWQTYSGFEIKIIPEELSGLLTPSILISYYTNISILAR